MALKEERMIMTHRANRFKHVHQIQERKTKLNFKTQEKALVVRGVY